MPHNLICTVSCIHHNKPDCNSNMLGCCLSALLTLLPEFLGGTGTTNARFQSFYVLILQCLTPIRLFTLHLRLQIAVFSVNKADSG